MPRVRVAAALGRDAYLQVRTPYNPMYYTLEVSRTSSGSLAAWATLKYFGMDGMRSILGGILENKYVVYDLIAKKSDMVCVNPDDSGLITLFRVYPEGVDAKKQFERELNEPDGRADSCGTISSSKPLATSSSSGSVPARRSTASTPIHELQHRLPEYNLQPGWLRC